MANIKQLSSFMVMNVNGGDRISYTFDELDAETGELKAPNTKESFFVVDEELRDYVEAIRDYIRSTRLA